MPTWTPPDALDRIAVIGAGTMGHGIAFAYATGGHDVTLYDADPDALDAARESIEDAAGTFVEAGRLGREEADDAVARVEPHGALPDAVGDADFVVEAVTEAMDVKREVFAELDAHAPGRAILASNTSGLSITGIAEAVSEPARVVGTHWFAPPHVVPLVEVVRGEHTADAAMDATYDSLDALGKTAIRVERDIPGFVGNRIQLAMIYEAFSLLERGVATAEEIDRAVKAGFGFRLPILGIFEKADHSGLDVHHAVETYLLPDLDRGTEPKELLTELVEDGRYGLKTGRGIYEWDRPTSEVFAERDRDLLAMLELYEGAGGSGESG